MFRLHYSATAVQQQAEDNEPPPPPMPLRAQFKTSNQGLHLPSRQPTPMMMHSTFDKNPLQTRLDRLVREEIENRKNNNPNAVASELNSIIPGFRNVLSKKRLLVCQFLWGLLIIVCLSLCIYQTVDRIRYYLSYPIISDVTVERQTHISFPTITICTGNNPRYLQWKNNEFKNIDFTTCYRGVAEFVGFGKTNDELWELTNPGPDCITTLFEQRGVPAKKGELDRSTMDMPFGRCTTINTKDKLLFEGQETRLEVKMPIANVTTCDAFGVMFAINHPDDNINPRRSYFTSARTVMQISLDYKHFIRLKTPSRPCFPLKQVAKCFETCVETRIKQLNITCTLPFFKDYTDKSLRECADRFEGEEMYSVAWGFLVRTDRQSTCGCGQPCDELIYTINRLPLKFETNTTILSFFYPTNEFDLIVEKYAYDFIALVGDIGGNLGLYLGLSIISFLELFESVWKCCGRKNKKKVKPQALAFQNFALK